MTIAAAFSVPEHERATFALETEACRKEVFRLLRVMQALANADRIGAAIAREAASLNWSPKTLRKYYDRYRHSGDWRALIDRRRFPAPDQRGQVPAEVVTLFKKLVDENKRKDRPAYDELMRMYHRGEEPAPGVPWPEFDPLCNHPRGCSLKNLQRKLDDFEKMAMRQGLGAALSEFGPKVLTTRVDLWVMSHLMIDDVLRDFRVMLLASSRTGQGKTARVQELGMLDVFSGDRFMVHRRPQFRRDEDGRKDSVKEREMRYLIGAWLRSVGYSPRGTEIVAELGTAAVRNALAAWLHKYSNSKITRREPGILGREQVIAGYWGAGGGNPRHKAPLESLHNLLHNEAGHLPAATGHDRNPPEWLHGIEAITEDVLEWMYKLPPEQAALVWAPELEYWQGLRVLEAIDHRIAWRTKHDLEGWVKLGHTRVEYLQDAVNDIWIGPEQYLALPQRTQEILMQAADAYPAFKRVRKLAPREVFSRGAGELIKFPDHVIALMFIDRDLGDDLRQAKRLNAEGEFEISDLLADPEEIIFFGIVTRPDGGEQRLERGKDYQVVLNPYDPTALWVYGKGGEVIGTAARKDRASRVIEVSVPHALGQRNQTLAEMLKPLNERHADAEKLIADGLAHNERLKRGEAVTAEDKALARRQAKRAGSVADFLGEGDGSPADEVETVSLEDLGAGGAEAGASAGAGSAPASAPYDGADFLTP